MFRRIVCSAGLAGIVAGIALTAIQQLQVVPVILEAETHEAALAPPELLQTFIFATAVTNAVFWIVLGAGCAIAFRKLA